MTRDDPRQLVITRVAEHAGRKARVPTRDEVPAHLLEQGVRRIRGVSLLFALLMAVSWLLPLTARGDLAGEFSRFYDWAPASFCLLVSLAMYFLSLGRRIAPSALAIIWLYYQVLLCVGLAFSQYWHTYDGLDASFFEFDRVGLSVIVFPMFFCTIMVPNRPRYVLLALAGCAAAVPIAVSLSIRAGDAPALPSADFFWIFCFPYLVCGAAAYIGAAAIYRLGRELRRAQELGSYRLERLLGRGGMGEVWRARHSLLVRPAAIKLIRRETIGVSQAAVSAAMARFEREAQVTAQLQSPHTVELYDFGTSQDGTLYYVMELLIGMDLETLVGNYGPVPSERAVYLLRQVCHSLADAHRLDLIHRDIKPANIYVCNRGLEYDFVKVLDFGLVALRSDMPGESVRLTTDGTVPGTPAYMAPEMASGGKIDGRADIYALGCVAYWLLTGQVVFEADTPVQALLAHASTEPVAPSQRTELEIPPALDAIILACLAKNPDDRPRDARELAQRLAECDLPAEWGNIQARSWWETHRPD